MSTESGPSPRLVLRRQLLEQRAAFFASDQGPKAGAELAGHLRRVVLQLEPQLLGLYWAVRSEFNVCLALAGDAQGSAIAWALPFTRRMPREMHYRRWDGKDPPLRDECNIPASAGAPAVPDVVLAPCVGHTRSGYRLGYGGGYFDRFLEQHPHVTTIGVAWAGGELDDAAYAAQPHDRPLTLIVTERGVIES